MQETGTNDRVGEEKLCLCTLQEANRDHDTFKIHDQGIVNDAGDDAGERKLISTPVSLKNDVQ